VKRRNQLMLLGMLNQSRPLQQHNMEDLVHPPCCDKGMGQRAAKIKKII